MSKNVKLSSLRTSKKIGFFLSLHANLFWIICKLLKKYIFPYRSMQTEFVHLRTSKQLFSQIKLFANFFQKNGLFFTVKNEQKLNFFCFILFFSASKS
jgi:hypothetical protein